MIKFSMSLIARDIVSSFTFVSWAILCVKKNSESFLSTIYIWSVLHKGMIMLSVEDLLLSHLFQSTIWDSE